MVRHNWETLWVDASHYFLLGIRMAFNLQIGAPWVEGNTKFYIWKLF